MIDPQACDAESSRTMEVCTVTAVDDNGATATINRLPAHSVRIDAALLAGRECVPGNLVLVMATRPDRFGFRGGPRVWTATAVLEMERPS